VPYLKQINTAPKRNSGRDGKTERKGGKGGKGDGKDDGDGQPADSTKQTTKVNYGKIVLDNSLRVLTLVKKVSGNYGINRGQALPGFMPQSQYIGLDSHTWAPGLGFVLGSTYGPDADIFEKAVANSIDVEEAKRWLTTDSILSQPYTRRSTETMSFRVNTEPMPGFKLDFIGNRNYAENQQHYFRYNEATNTFDVFTPTNNGNFSMSYFMAGTSFVRTDSIQSRLFDNLLENRKIIAERIARNNPQWIEEVNEYTYDSVAGDYFPKGYNSSSMEVLLYSFIAAYTGRDPNTLDLNPFPRIPLPNWNLTYSGLTNIPAIGELFKTVSLTHNYKSSYAINQWASNVYYDEDNTIQTFENSDLIVPRYDIGQIVLTEQYAPLIGIDLGLQNSMTTNFQFKKSRTLTLSFANNQLTEVNSREYVIGAGYRIKNVSFSFTPVGGNGKSQTIKNDLVLKLDIGFKRDITILRRIDERNCQVSAGQNKINFYFTADYNFSQQLSAQAFFKYDLSIPEIANTFRNSTTYGGITLRFNLAATK
jgi:cell surface protein SprA